MSLFMVSLSGGIGVPANPDTVAGFLRADREYTPVHSPPPQPHGGVAEWPNAAVLKTAVPQPQAAEGAGLVASRKAVLSSCLSSDPDFARVAEAWPMLAKPLRASILALIGAAQEEAP